MPAKIIADEKFKEDLYRKYIIERLGPYDIASEYGVHAKTIYYHIDKFGFPRIKYQNQELAGKTIGNLKVIKFFGKRKNSTNIWECESVCCGKTYYLDTGHINKQRLKCCIKVDGVFHKRIGEYNLQWKGCGDLSGNKWQAIKMSAKKRNINFNITIQEAYNRFNGICSISGIEISFKGQTASLDRIDSSKPYELNNVWWVHKHINLIKSSLTLDRFYEICYHVIYPLKIKYNNIIPIGNDFWSDVFYNAKRRKILLNITKEESINLLYKQRFRCKITGEYIHLQYGEANKGLNRTASLDRIDSNKDYTIDNVQWVHKEVNQSRKQLSLEYYKELCNLVVNYRNLNVRKSA